MNKENRALKFVDEIILYYDARSKKHQITKNKMRGMENGRFNLFLFFCFRCVLHTCSADIGSEQRVSKQLNRNT